MEFFELVKYLLINYGVAAALFLGFFEEVVFIIPSTLVFLALGFLGISKTLTVEEALIKSFLVYGFWGALGVILGSVIVYWAAFYGGKYFIERFGKYFGVSWGELERWSLWFGKGYKDELVVFVARALPFLPITLVTLAGGVLRLPWRMFFLMTFLGTMVRVGILVFFGWFLGETYGLWLDWELFIERWIFGLSAVTILGIIIYFHERGKRLKK